LKKLRSTVAGFDRAQVKLFGCVLYHHPSTIAALANELYKKLHVQVFVGKCLNGRPRRSTVFHPRLQMIFVAEHWPEADGATELPHVASLLLPAVTDDYPYGVWEQRAPHTGDNGGVWAAICSSGVLNSLLQDVVDPQFDFDVDIQTCEVTPWRVDRRLSLQFPIVLTLGMPVLYIFLELVNLGVDASTNEKSRSATILQHLRRYRLPDDDGGFYQQPFGGGTPYNAWGTFFWDGYATFRTSNDVRHTHTVFGVQCAFVERRLRFPGVAGSGRKLQRLV
jgi:hypothetical protein